MMRAIPNDISKPPSESAENLIVKWDRVDGIRSSFSFFNLSMASSIEFIFSTYSNFLLFLTFTFNQFCF